ncbi:uncharacterized protein LOC108674625 [Hyalella azteca]|uniref:Uncharacterized protein LOC108674625 n=1 Tax=Hyalella azteca TaxID=294128 RepID=A0A8B7NWG9_HYAAZ|nr:uncharacterized protein LOC108674625 [Hyalella azteca]
MLCPLYKLVLCTAVVCLLPVSSLSRPMKIYRLKRELVYSNPADPNSHSVVRSSHDQARSPDGHAAPRLNLVTATLNTPAPQEDGVTVTQTIPHLVTVTQTVTRQRAHTLVRVDDSLQNTVVHTKCVTKIEPQATVVSRVIITPVPRTVQVAIRTYSTLTRYLPEARGAHTPVVHTRPASTRGYTYEEPEIAFHHGRRERDLAYGYDTYDTTDDVWNELPPPAPPINKNEKFKDFATLTLIYE